MVAALAHSMVSQQGWRVETRDAGLHLSGVCDVWTKLAVTMRHRRAGGWTLTLPGGHTQAGLFAEGTGIILWAPWSTDTPMMSGPVTGISVATPSVSEPAMMTVTGVDDTALLADRIVLPDPSSSMDSQASESHWTDLGPAEACIRRVVNLNAGLGATPGRGICDADPYTVLPGGVGTVRNVVARFDNLLTLIDELATIDNLSVRLIQPPGLDQRHLEVAATVDRTDSILLAQAAGTLTSATANLEAPKATTVLVAGGGEGEARILVQRDDPVLEADWSRRIETFRDARDTSELDELAQRGDETLAEAAATAGIAVQPVDTDSQRFGEHYRLGDTVRIEVGAATYTEIITGVQISVDQSATAIVPLIGDEDAAAAGTPASTPAIYARVRDIRRRLEALERRQ